jgi:2-polyprenyl-3-methyl-5-hydroxy-6-metoxy-1,4-benzoquinol methylase
METAETVEAAVREQYRRYPYPPRDPADEQRRLIATWLGNLALVNGVFWGGRKDPGRLRVLDAGCGTGDATIYMAQQAPGAAVVALDQSPASLDVVRRRAGARGLRNIQYVNASLGDLPGLGLEPFDYILCSGVLHHLVDPGAGLAALAGVLGEGGGLGIMLYATFGRMPIYLLQELLRRLTWRDPLPERVAVAEEVLGNLSPHHYFKIGNLEREFADVTKGPAGIVDLLLHAQDQPYTVPEVYALLASCGLSLLAFDPPVFYRPESYALGDGTRRRLAAMGEPERQAVAELFHGRLTQHRFYAVRAGAVPDVPLPDADPESVRPVVYEPLLADYLARLDLRAQPFHLESPWGFTVTLELAAADCALLRAVDGRRSLAAVLERADAARRRGRIPRPETGLLAGWKRLYEPLAAVGYLGYHWADR